MESERIELLQSLKTYLSEGVLSVEKFPQKHVIEAIWNEYDSWLSEKRCQLEEYLSIYNVLMSLAAEKGDFIQLSAFLDELICDMKMTSINSCERLDSLRSIMDDAVINIIDRVPERHINDMAVGQRQVNRPSKDAV